MAGRYRLAPLFLFQAQSLDRKLEVLIKGTVTCVFVGLRFSLCRHYAARLTVPWRGLWCGPALFRGACGPCGCGVAPPCVGVTRVLVGGVGHLLEVRPPQVRPLSISKRTCGYVVDHLSVGDMILI